MITLFDWQGDQLAITPWVWGPLLIGCLVWVLGVVLELFD